MSQNIELEQIKERIRKLSSIDISRGNSESEMLKSMDMIGKLLGQYNLTMDEVDLRAEPCVALSVQSGAKSRCPIDYTVKAIANFCDSVVWFNKQPVNSRYFFYGMEKDVQMAIYLFNIIKSAMESELNLFKQTSIYTRPNAPRRTLSTNFQKGMAATISRRLNTMKEEIDASIASQRTTGNALMIIKKKLVDDEFKNYGLKLRKKQSPKFNYDPRSYSHGNEAGYKVNLSRPIEQDRETILKIGFKS